MTLHAADHIDHIVIAVGNPKAAVLMGLIGLPLSKGVDAVRDLPKNYM